MNLASVTASPTKPSHQATSQHRYVDSSSVASRMDQMGLWACIRLTIVSPIHSSI